MAIGKLTRELHFTEVYKKYKDEHIAIREAMCLKAQFPGFLGGIEDNDLFAGRLDLPAVGITPDEWGPTSFGYYCIEQRLIAEIEDPSLDEDYRQAVKDMLDFWREENTSTKLRRAFPEKMARELYTDDWMNQSGISFPLYRLCGGYINFDKLLQIGIPGLYEEVERYRQKAEREGGDVKFYEGARIALDVFVDTCLHFSNMAFEMAETARTKERAEELRLMGTTLKKITKEKPAHLWEAIQLMWLYSLVADVRNLGRMDVYLGDFYVNDLETGALTEEDALRYLESLWQLIADRNTRVHGRVIIGGKGRRNEENADKFALLAMEATRRVLEVEPQLSLRFYEGMNPALFAKALDVIGEGRTYPILYNDDVNIKAVEEAFGFTTETAEQYVPFGCGEYIIDHQSFGTPSGVINLLKALEVTMHNGIDPMTGRKMGLALGRFEDFETFDELFEAYKKQVEYFVEIMADHEELEYKIAGETAPFLYMSMLYDDCLERGKGMFSGGVRYLGGTLETYGNTNTADSLTAIKKLVYDEKVISKERLLAALDADFEGYEDIRQLLLDAPKYGNDDDTADEMLLKVHNHVCNAVRDQRHRTSLHSYLVVIINNSANTLMGHQTSASADGRRSGLYMNNGNAPMSGMDKNGITAMLNSIVKPSTHIHAGAVQNMKFSREMFTTRRAELEALLKTYFQNGGAQAMITVVNRNDLERAMEEPEKYHHIFVRVGGFSARFVELGRDVQLDILNRTLY
ncbi:MAG TPA: pyruvate formate lyase family protein [Candidatus Atribacteria bacterium]|nr:pyruvate formate lyase family protein [Candidatus Atribacteria bacterium]